MVLAELAIFPIGKGISLSPYVAKVIKKLKKEPVSLELTSMGTILEGEWLSILEAINKAFLTLKNDAERIYMTVKIDYKKGRKNAMKSKINSVNNILE